jgi:hypothetical protein
MPKKKTPSPHTQVAVPAGLIERRIYLIRRHKVMLANDLAELYQVPTFRLNEQVKRNIRRFPKDFMFQLTAKETKALTSQIAISNKARLRLVFDRIAVSTGDHACCSPRRWTSLYCEAPYA